jgi:hypothetical protein
MTLIALHFIPVRNKISIIQQYYSQYENTEKGFLHEGIYEESPQLKCSKTYLLMA